MKKTLLFSFTQLVCTILYSSSELENNTDVKQEQIEQVQITTCEEICDPNPVLVETILVPECKSCWTNFFVEASILYWHPKISGTEFTSGFLTINPLVIDGKIVARKTLIDGNLQPVDLGWNWGGKASIGYNLPCDNWDISLHYTGFNSKGCKSICAKKNNEYITNYKIFPFNSLLATLDKLLIFNHEWVSKKASSKLYMNLHALQLDLGKSFCVCESIVLYSKIGFEGSWITCEQNTRYISVQPLHFLIDSEATEKVLALRFDYVIKDYSKFSGVGPYFSFGLEWNFFDNIYFYGNISGSLVYKSFKTYHKDKTDIYSVSSEAPIRPEEKKYILSKNCVGQFQHAFVPRIDMQIGISYNTVLNSDQMQLTFKLGFDAQYIWRINQMLETRDVTINFRRISEDMGIHGFTFDMRLDF